MKTDPQSCPGFVCLTCGAVYIGLSVARLASGVEHGPGLFEFSSLAVGVALAMWGWSRVRRAKAADPEISWLRLLHTELIAVGLLAVLLPVWMAISPEQRDRILRSMADMLEVFVRIRFGH